MEMKVFIVKALWAKNYNISNKFVVAERLEDIVAKMGDKITEISQVAASLVIDRLAPKSGESKLFRINNKYLVVSKKMDLAVVAFEDAYPKEFVFQISTEEYLTVFLSADNEDRYPQYHNGVYYGSAPE